MPLFVFYTMVQKSQKWPKTQIKGGPALTAYNIMTFVCLLVDGTRCSEYFVQLFEVWTWLVCMLACVRLCVTSQLSRATWREFNFVASIHWKKYKINFHTKFSSTGLAGHLIVSLSFRKYIYEINFHAKGFLYGKVRNFSPTNFFFYYVINSWVRRESLDFHSFWKRFTHFK